jgi:hypothetical protein
MAPTSTTSTSILPTIFLANLTLVGIDTHG